MNDREVLEFFNKVKDKKIRWTNWEKSTWFIPKKLLSNETMVGINEKGTKTYGVTYGVVSGFNKCRYFHNNWEIIDPILDLVNLANEGRDAADELLDKHLDRIKRVDGRFVIK